MNKLNKIKEISKSPWLTRGLIVLLIIILALSCQKNANLKREAAIKDQNQLALTDSIKLEKTKSGALNASISGFIAKEKDLKDLNKELYKDVKNQKGKVVTLSKAVVKLTQDKKTLEKFISEFESEPGDIIHINDSSFIAPWELTFRYDSTNYDILKGKTKISYTTKNNPDGGIIFTPTFIHDKTWLEFRESQINLTFGQRIEDDKLRVFVQSDYPGFTAESLSGVLIDPNTNPYFKSLMKKRRWFTGMHIGLGTTLGYNIPTGKIGFVIGPTLTWSILNL